MKTMLFILAVAAGQAAGQVATPTTPTKFGTRTMTGGSSTGSVNVTTPPAETTVRLVSHFTLDQPRQWKSTDGRSLLGSIIAFEDSVVEMKAANRAAAVAAAQNAPAPKPPEKFTIIKDGKVRLLVNQKPVEVPLDRLSEEDRAYAAKVNAAAGGKP
ncbi:MAG: hypothetical protein HS117_04185 [Verrucomicrobiaceae bacterium]|jgi:hypothetical protein|nr:hypothetical protein [Verrucomicrobiaceae bacterium]